MDTPTFIVEMTKALAWPGVASLLLLLYRKQVGGILSGVKLRRIGQGTFKAEFETIADAVRGELPSKISAPEKNVKPALEFVKEEGLLGTSPQSSILSAWEKAEGIVNAISAREKIRKANFPETLEALSTVGLISKEIRESLLGLQKLRNLAVHGPKEKVTAKEAREFLALARAAVSGLEDNLKKVK